MYRSNWNSKLVDEYIIKYYKNIETRKTVKTYLRVFFTTIDKAPEKWIKGNEKSIIEDIWSFIKIIENKPPKTQSTVLNIVKKFLERHDFEIKSRQWEEIRQRNNLNRNVRPLGKKGTPTQHDLKTILSHATGIKSKTFFITLASSGLRIGELLKITWDDINFDKRMIMLDETKAKDGIPRFTFFSEEAKELLLLWKPERDKQLCKRYRKSVYLRKSLEKQGFSFKKETHWYAYKDGKKISKEELIQIDKRVFPYNSVNFEKIWHRLLESAGEPYNNRDNNPRLQHGKYLFNIHSIRRFWFTQLRSDRMNNEYYNYIGGHTSLLDRAYGDWLFDPIMQEKIKKDYDEHMGVLSIYQAVPDLKGIHQELQEKDRQIKDMQDEMQQMKAEILEMRIKRLEKQNGIKK